MTADTPAYEGSLARGLIPSIDVHKGVTTGPRIIHLPGVAGRLPVPSPNSKFGLRMRGRKDSTGTWNTTGRSTATRFTEACSTGSSCRVSSAGVREGLSSTCLSSPAGDLQALPRSEEAGDLFLCFFTPLKPLFLNFPLLLSLFRLTWAPFPLVGWWTVSPASTASLRIGGG